MTKTPKRLATWLVALVVLSGAAPLVAQEGAAPPAAAPAAPTFKPEELDQLVAPVALYPDALLAQVLMASTYPLEIVQAARWSKENPNLKETALQDAMQQQPWDPSVKSLCAFPQVLTMMNEKLDWTQKLGDVFLAQQQDVMTAVQRLRIKAEAAGNLKSNDQQKVIVEPAPATVQQNVTVQQAPPQTQVIKIEQANPQVVYVPTYNPSVVYGPWPYPAYPPYSYYPPGYVATTSLLSFGAGMAVGAALWGNCNWGHGNVNVNVNNYNSYNKTNISNNNWQHNVEHRKGVQYRDTATQQRYGKGNTSGVQSREAFRGRAQQGQQQLARGAASDVKGPAGRPADRGGRPAGQRGGATGAQRDAARTRPQTQPQRATAAARDAGKRGNPAAFQGIGNGQQARAQSDRGRASRQSAAASGGGGRPAGGAAGGKTRAGGGGGRRK